MFLIISTEKITIPTFFSTGHRNALNFAGYDVDVAGDGAVGGV